MNTTETVIEIFKVITQSVINGMVLNAFFPKHMVSITRFETKS